MSNGGLRISDTGIQTVYMPLYNGINITVRKHVSLLSTICHSAVSGLIYFIALSVRDFATPINNKLPYNDRGVVAVALLKNQHWI